MLRSIRSHAKNFVSKIILALLIASFAVWGIGDMVVSRPGQEEVAKVGNVVISRQAVEKEMQRDIAQLRERLGEQYKPEFLSMLNIPQQVVKRMVMQELIRQETKALGVLPSNEMVADVMRRDPMFQNDDGKFDKKKFLYILRQAGMAERDFVQMMREDIAHRLLSQAMSGNYGVQDMAVKVMQAASGEKRDVVIYNISPKAEAASDPTDQELDAYYESVSDRYAIPEYRSVSYVTIDESNIASEINISPEEIKQMYEERIDEFKTPQMRDLELFLYTGKENAEKAKAMLEVGKTHQEVSKALPPANVTNTLMKGITKGRLPEALEATVFSLDTDQVSEVIASDFGFHVARVVGISESKTKSLTDVEDSLRNEMKTNRATSMLTQKTDALEDKLAGGSTLAEAAKELGLAVKKVENFSKRGENPAGKTVAIPDLKNFVPMAFNTTNGESSSISMGKAGVYYLLHVDHVQAEQLPPIAEVKGELLKSWQESRRQTMAMKHAGEVAAKLGDPMQRDAVVASDEVTKLTAGVISRDNLKLGGVDLPPDLVQSIFAVEVGGVTRSSKLANGRYILAVVNGSEMPPLKESLDEDAKALRATIQSNQQQEIMQQLMTYLNRQYNVQVNQAIMNQIGKSDG